MAVTILGTSLVLIISLFLWVSFMFSSKQLGATARKIWSDPVWSKVIAGGILAGISWLWLSQHTWTKLLVTAGWLLFWGTCVYVRYATRPPLIKASTTPKSVQRFSRRIRRIATTGMVVIPIVYLCWQYVERLPPRDIIVLVANFDGDDPKNYRVTEIIRKNLREATKSYADVTIKPLNYTITETEGFEVAEAKGREEKASIVIWGWYGKTNESVYLTAHCEIMRTSARLLNLKGEETLISPISDLERFTVQQRIGDEMSFLTLVIAGMARYEAKDYVGAVSRFSQALDLATTPEQMPATEMIHFFRGNSYIFTFDWVLAFGDFNETIKINPNNASAYGNRAALAMGGDDFERAIIDSNKAIALDSREPVFYLTRGMAYFMKEDLDRAIEDFNESINLKPTAAGYINRGFTYRRKGNLDLAIVDFDEAIRLTPNIAEPYYQRGLAYLTRGDVDRALIDLNRAVEFNPKSPLAHFNRGIAYSKKKDHNRTIADFDETIKLDPDNDIAYLYRGVFYDSVEELDNAISNYTQSLNLKPENVIAYLNRGIDYLKKGDLDRAIVDFDQAVKLSPSDYRGYSNRGTAYEKKGQLDRAIADFDKVTKLRPNEAEGYLSRGIALEKKGDQDNAISDYKKVLELTVDPYLSQMATAHLERLNTR